VDFTELLLTAGWLPNRWRLRVLLSSRWRHYTWRRHLSRPTSAAVANS